MHRLAAWLLLSPLLVSAAGEKVPNFTLPDTGGRKHTLHDLKDAKAVVLLFIGKDCPLVNRYVPRMNDLHRDYAPKGVVFFGVNSNVMETPESIAEHAKESGFPFPVLLDRAQQVADSVGVEQTPTAVVVDASWERRYRGRIDDHASEDLVRARHLRDALDAVLAGRDVATAETTVVGCLLQREMRAAADAEVTYSEHVAPILDRACVSCHRPGQVAPFSLRTFAEARRWARDIKRWTAAKSMPPWKPANHGAFRGERVLTDEEIALVGKWADAGAPEGDARKRPPAPEFRDDWLLGPPDEVLTAPEHEVEAAGADEYRCFVLPTAYDEDRWVSAVEVRPGNLRVVHHVIVYVDTSGASDRLDDRDEKPGYRSDGTGPGFIPVGEMSGWAPGNMPYALPEGVARLLPKGARLVVEVHYHKNGRIEKDRTSVGLHFAKSPVRQRWHTTEMINFNFRIPAGAERHRVFARKTVREEITLHSIMPHLHLTGREVLVEATLPDDTKRTLIHIKDWDFNWQDTYHFKEPVKLPKGTKLAMQMWYDNSEGNPNNPSSPPRDLTWGEQTTDEMAITFLFFTRDNEDLTQR